jgi:Restriction Enzyme Adenine Methylase Associated
MHWISDGPVIRGWQLLRGATARPGETPRQRFLQAADRGLPIFSNGLRLLIDGLKVVDRDRHDDREVAAAITRMGDYAAVTDWSRTVLTFTGNDPDSPTPRPIPTARSGGAGTVMLYSVTLDDLVARGLLRPGALLHAGPRPARQVGAAYTDTAQVTADGLICWESSHFANPNEALIATQPDMTDGWYAWSTPDGETLDSLRRRARQSPPISET